MKNELKNIGNLFDNLNFENLEQDNVKEINSNDNKLPLEEKNNKVIINDKIISQVDDFFELIKPKKEELIQKAIKINIINNDDENSFARKIGGELNTLKKMIDDEKKKINKPLKEAIDLNNEKAKNLIEPIDNQISRIKLLITNYELEKERKKREEIERIERERKEKEEKERKEKERINNIKNEINRLKENSAKTIFEANTEEELNKIENKIGNWHPKKEFFMEFYDEVIQLKNEIKLQINNRRITVKELEEARKKAELLEKQNKEAAERERQLIAQKLQEEKLRKEQEEAAKKAAEESEELSAKNELIILTTSLEIKDFEKYINDLKLKYGSFKQAILKRDEIVKTYYEEKERQIQLKNLENQKLKNQRVDFVFTIDDESQVPREYLSVDEQKIKKAIQQNRELLLKDINSFKINGITITSKIQTVLKQ